MPIHNENETDLKRRLPKLVLGTIGIVFGDIGTSPLYTLRQCFTAHPGFAVGETEVLSVLSLIFWALMIVVTAKYVTLLLRADNRGEGGILALTALALRSMEPKRRLRRFAIAISIVGAALFLGDGIITPAISVLSAIEGLQIATPMFEPYVVPLAVAVLIGLFFFQRRGTSRVGAWFGPITAVWFLTIAILGLVQIVQMPGVLRAIDPLYAANLLATRPWRAFVVLGAVVLAITGSEALYADMGHFGRFPLRVAWFAFVLPALLLNYFGQGALLISDPSTVTNPFYLLAPAWGLYPMVLLATLATVIASQAVISGAFSLLRQAIQLGYLPRLEVRHTSELERGQIFLPAANGILMIGVVAVAIGFGSSSDLAASYGIAVTGALAIDTVLAFIVARLVWRWNLPASVVVFGVFLVVELTFLFANSLKIPEGGWFPIVVAIVLSSLMSTWRKGRQALFDRLYKNAPDLASFIKIIGKRPPTRVPGTAVFLTTNVSVVPRALLHNLKHNKVMHERIVLLTVATEDVPRIAPESRLEVHDFEAGFQTITVRYGFMEQPNVPRAISRLGMKPRELSFFLSRETFIPSARPELSPWRERIFMALSNTAADATEFFRIPPDRVVELGTQVEI